MKYTVGDKVRVVASAMALASYDVNKCIKTGDVYIVTRANGYGVNLGSGISKNWVKDDMVELLVEKKEMKETPPSYTFNIASKDQISPWSIANTLSYANPLALVDVGDEVWAVISDTLLNVAAKKGIKCEYKWVNVLENKSETSKVVAWCKKVKAAPWKTKCKATVTVTYVKV